MPQDPPALPSPLPSCYRPQALETAALDWQNQTPVATSFQDVYFSRDQGPAESHCVFLEQNHLPERWAEWFSPRAFVVGETGWGTGLNFLVAARLFLQKAPPQARLHWVSTEIHPLTPEDLQRAHQFWPELAQEAAWLQAVYPLPVSGFHRLLLHPRITVDLLLGDAATNLDAWQGRVDAWCLDGFSPSKNPELWTAALFSILAQHSHPHTTLATFTSAGAVRRGLEAAGFAIEKVPGFGRKREMLRGRFKHKTQHQGQASRAAPIAVVGGGLSGLATAEALIRKGFQVDLYEAERLGAGASGNRQGVLYVKLAVDTNRASRFYLAGLEYTRRWLQRLDPDQVYWQDTGVLQLAFDSKEAARQTRFLQQQQLPSALVHWVDQAQARALIGLTPCAGGLFYPRAGWVRPGALCQHLGRQLTQPQAGLRLFEASPLLDLEPLPQGGWALQLPEGVQVYEQVVLATATATRGFTPTTCLPVKSIRGQVSQRPFSGTLPKRVVCGKGYITPPWGGQLCFGATFNLHTQDPQVRWIDHESNWDALHLSLPHFYEEAALAALSEATGLKEDATAWVGRVAFRCTSPDYLPLVGAAPFFETAQHAQEQTKKRHPGLWLNLGQGSRGLASIPLAAELLASEIAQEAAPLERDLLQALDPGRFLRSKSKSA